MLSCFSKKKREKDEEQSASSSSSRAENMTGQSAASTATPVESRAENATGQSASSTSSSTPATSVESKAENVTGQSAPSSSTPATPVESNAKTAAGQSVSLSASKKNKVEEVDDCLICWMVKVKKMSLSCGCKVGVCDGCLAQWLRSSPEKRCVFCRQTTSSKELSESEVTKGYKKIARAEAGGFENKQLLKDALHHFINAISCDSENTNGYVGMAYITLLVDDLIMAGRYLYQVKLRNGEDGDYLKLSRYAADAYKKKNPSKTDEDFWREVHEASK